MSDPANETELNEDATAVEGESLTITQEVKDYIAGELAQVAGQILARVDERIDEAHRVFDERFAALEQEFQKLDPAALAQQIVALEQVAGDLQVGGLTGVIERVKALEDRIRHFV